MELTREEIRKTVEDFFAEHEEKELIVTVSLDSSNRKAISYKMWAYCQNRRNERWYFGSCSGDWI